MNLKENIYRFKSILRHPVKFLNARKSTSTNKSDLTRWEKEENLYKEWDSRTIMIAGLIPEKSSILEFGAARLVLRDHIPDNCDYQPSDIVDRGENTIVCDLNHKFPVLSTHYTHVVFSGVLEYIFDIDNLLKELKQHCDVIIASYSTTDKISDYVTRRQSGWVNHFSNEDIVSLFNKNGFTLKSSHSWTLQTIYVFEQTK